ncbi:MAG: ribosome maturation factor RimP [Clostridiales bacterium]|nr:ribosome maturation factor RimP [Candidatus Crickella merdequi]
MAKEDVCSRVTSILEEYLTDKELETYAVQYKKEGPDWKLKVFLDKPEGAETEYVNINECEEVTRYLSDKLDELDFIDKSYVLEVSSPGLDRELIKDKDFVRFSGRLVEARLYEAINGSKNIEGELIGKEEGIVKIAVGNEELEIPEKKISKINLAIVF